MRRTGRRHASDYLEENEEIIQGLNEGYEEYNDFDIATEDDNELYEAGERTSAVKVWSKIGKVALVILVLIALFFISMKITEICLDRNQEPTSYGNDAPAYSQIDTASDDEDTPSVTENEEPEEEKEPENKQPTYHEEVENTKPAAKPAEDTKPEENKKPETTGKTEETENPSTPAPSTPSKPVITPGNPAA